MAAKLAGRAGRMLGSHERRQVDPEEQMATKIESDVSGSMWKLIASPGDMVEADAEIAIIESMKMEIPVVAPRAGKLARFLVAEGEAVAEGQAVAEIE